MVVGVAMEVARVVARTVAVVRVVGRAVARAVATVGRRGTNQLRLVERYLDFLVKHTTEFSPPTALVERTAPSSLVEGVSLR